ncbi:MAG: ABC transporter ATP-binding protein [Deltaproteobacteria bacterium]|nr:ABC transporter ATP-binding protein [Deltaproteobacteria bacterium]
MNPIEVKHLSKFYEKRRTFGFIRKMLGDIPAKFKAVDDVSFTVKNGEIFGLLGPNGAGKTTIIKIISGLLKPTSGEALLNGKNPLTNKLYVGKILGFMFSNSMIYWRMTGFDNLNYFAKIYNVPDRRAKINEKAKMFGLEKWINDYVENYSLGMLCKLSFCRLLLTDPEIIVLDEPTLGLDPMSIIQIRNIIRNLRESGKTIILTTHNMREAEQLSDRIGFLSKGKIIKLDTPSNLKSILRSKLKLVVESPDSAKIKDELIDMIEKEDILLRDGQIEFHFDNGKNEYSEILKILAKYRIIHVKEQEPDLEGIFFQFSSE